MKFQTTRFGLIDVKEKDIIVFPEGLLGFEELKKYVLIDQGDDTPFKWLQSLEEAKLAFIVIQPIKFLFEYNLEISDDDAEFLNLKSSEEAIIYSIVTVPKDVSKMTGNLQGPLIINARSWKGKQVVCTDPAYHTRHEILTELEKRNKKILKDSEQDSKPDSGKGSAKKQPAGKSGKGDK